MEFLAQSLVLKDWELSELLCQFQFTDPKPSQSQLLQKPPPAAGGLPVGGHGGESGVSSHAV